MSRFWSRLLLLELLMLGIAVIALAYFAHLVGLDAGAGWGTTRVLGLGVGFAFCATGGVLALPGVRARIGAERMERSARYLQRALLWGLLPLLAVELFMRVYGYTPVPWKVDTNWFGSVQVAGTSSWLGDEGFARTHYGEYGEVATPFDSGDNIIVVGDSRTEARQVSDDQKYASVAETLLRQRGLDVNVRNFGRSALALSDYTAHVPKYIELFHPRLIVVQLSEADMSESFSTERSNYFILRDDGTLELITRRDISGPLVVSPKKTANIYPIMLNYAVERVNLIFPTASADEGQSQPLSDSIRRKEIEMLLQAAGDTPVIFLLFPTVPVVEGDGIALTSDSFTCFVDIVRSAPGAQVIDSLPRFQQLTKEGHFPVGFFNSADPDRGHLNVYGNQAVGEMLADAIEEALQ